ncbi:UNVERIFIED_CONTAM: hypothetical protein Sindi_0035900 [Sesamum indicum]
MSFKWGSAPFPSIGSNRPDSDPSAFENPDNCGHPIADASQQDGATWLANSALLSPIYRSETPSLKVTVLHLLRLIFEIAHFSLDHPNLSVGGSLSGTCPTSSHFVFYSQGTQNPISVELASVSSTHLEVAEFEPNQS